MKKLLTDHTRLLCFLAITVITLSLAIWKLGGGFNSHFWKLAGRIPGASLVSSSAVLANVLTTSEDQLGPALVEAHKLLASARDRRKILDETLVLDTGKRAMLAAQRGSDLEHIAWQTVSAAISYGSALKASFEVPIAAPECFSTRPQWVLAQGINDTQTVIAIKPVFSSCRLNLDLVPGKKPRTYENGFDCSGCLVAYGGGKLAILSPTFTFQRSVFSFSIVSEPPLDGRRLTETLLASKFAKAET